MRKFILFVSLIWVVYGKGQFLDFNLFKPRVNFSSQYVLQNQADSLSIGLQDFQVSTLIPIKSKFTVKMDWGNILKSKGLKDAFIKTVNPKFYQVFGRAGLGYRTYYSNLFKQPVNAYNFSGGISGIKLQLRSGKFRFLMYSFNVRLQEQFDKYNEISPSISGMLGAAKVFDYRSIFFYGLYVNYFGGRVIPAPILGLHYRFNYSSSFTIVFPYQAKYTMSLGNKVNQDFAVSLNGFANGIYNDSIFPNNGDARLNFQYGQIRFSSQTRFNLRKKSFFYLELGWQELNNYVFFKGGQIYDSKDLKGSPFIKAAININIGRSLFNSSVFDLDI